MRGLTILLAAATLVAPVTAAAHTTDAVANCNSVTVRYSNFPPGLTITQNVYVDQQVVNTAVFTSQRGPHGDTVTLGLSTRPEARYDITATIAWVEGGVPQSRVVGPYTVTCGVPAPPPELVPPTAPEPPATPQPSVPTAPPITPRNPTRPAPNCVKLRKSTSSLRLLDDWGCAPRCPRGTLIIRKRNSSGKLVWTCYRTPARPTNPPRVAG